jgi:ryanodine receptor 2
MYMLAKCLLTLRYGNILRCSCRFLFGGTEGRLKHGPPMGYSAIVEAVSGKIQLEECVSFGELQKNIYSGPGTILYAHEPYVPQIVDISRTILPHFAMDIHQRLAENMHELWAQRKIELGWSFGDVRSETQRTHPCLNSFDRLPGAEKAYNTNLAIDTMK